MKAAVVFNFDKMVAIIVEKYIFQIYC